MTTPGRIGPYEILAELGRGGMGIVYRARHVELGRAVALKVMGATGADPEALERFRREARAAASLAAHPGIVGVHDAGEHDGRPWLAMELVEGRSLDALIEETELAPATVARLLAETARAVHHAHQAGLLHRDLKPANILVATGDGRARVTDFGLARRTAADALTRRLTASDAVVGTPAFMSPEQALGDPLDARADVWSLGATLYAGLAGAPPFGAGAVVEVIARVLQADPPPLEMRARGVPPALAAIAARCLAKSRDDRYPSAAALAEDLERHARGEPVAARRPTPVRRLARWVRRRRTALAAAVVLAVGAGLAWWAARLPAPDGRAGRGARESPAAPFLALTARLTEPLARLEDHAHGASLAATDRDAALAAVAAAVAEVAGRPPSPLGAAFEALARVYADGDPALPALRAAAEAAPADPFPRALLARALVHGWSLEVDLPEMVLLADAARVAPLRESAAAAARRAEAAALAAQLAPEPGALAHAAATVAYVRALADLTGGRHADAAARLRELADDAAIGPGVANLAGIAAFLAGDYAAAAAWFERTAARGWPRAAERAARAHLNDAMQRRLRGAPAGAPLAAARQVLDRALAAGPPLSMLLIARSLVWSEEARVRAVQGGDQAAAFAAALADLDRVLALEPGHVLARVNRGSTRLTLGSLQARAHRPEAAATLAAAVADLDRVLDVPVPGLAPLAVRAEARRELAELAWRRGQEGEAELRAADADFRLAIEREPADARYRTALGRLWVAAAAARFERGADGAPAAAAAVAALDGAIAAEPSLAGAWHVRGMAWRTLALGRIRHREDPADALARAAADLTEALARGADPLDTRVVRGSVFAIRARAAMAAGADPTAALAAAEADFDAAIARAPVASAPWAERAMVWLARADWARQTGGAPDEHWRQALADLQAALDRGYDPVQALLRRAEVRRLQGAWALERGVPDPGHADAALADLDAALARLPGDARLLQARLAAALHGVRVAEATGADPAVLGARALADLDALAARGPLGRAHHAQRIALAENLGRRAAALDACRAALREFPDDAEFRRRLAALEAPAGR